VKYQRPLVESRELAILTSFPRCFHFSFISDLLYFLSSAVTLFAEALGDVGQQVLTLVQGSCILLIGNA